MEKTNRNEKQPLVSVIIPAYNAETYIEEAIRSVQRQTVKDWELIVIDDGSRDSTCDRIEMLAAEDPRILFVRNEQNMGTAKTRNRGLELSRGTYVALLDSDDVWYSEKLEKQLTLIEREAADIVYTSYALVEDGKKHRRSNYYVPATVTFRELLRQNVIGCSTVLLRKSALKDHYFDSAYYHEDYVLWLTLLQEGKKAVGEKTVLLDYRLHNDSRAANKASSARRRWTIYRQYLKLPLPHSAFYLMQYAYHGFLKYKRI